MLKKLNFPGGAEKVEFLKHVPEPIGAGRAHSGGTRQGDDPMCRQVTCPQCGKPTWAGCGAHVEQVLGHIPKDARCKCREQQGNGNKR